MEVGEGSNNGRGQSQKPGQMRQRKASVGMNFEQSVENLSRAGRETLVMVMNKEKRGKILNRRPNTTCVVFDNSNTQYRWLPSGWLVEERFKVFPRRLYRYYYDPIGQTYKTREEVETIYRDTENNPVVITLDD